MPSINGISGPACDFVALEGGWSAAPDSLPGGIGAARVVSDNADRFERGLAVVESTRERSRGGASAAYPQWAKARRWMEAGTPIKLLIEPVIAPDGYIYERDDIELYLASHSGELPSDYGRIKKKQLRPDRSLMQRLNQLEHGGGGESSEESEDIPEHLTCCIGMDLMVDPVIASDGHTYELQTLREIVRRHGVSPFDREPLKNHAYRHRSLVREINAWRSCDALADTLLKPSRVRVDGRRHASAIAGESEPAVVGPEVQSIFPPGLPAERRDRLERFLSGDRLFSKMCTAFFWVAAITMLICSLATPMGWVVAFALSVGVAGATVFAGWLARCVANSYLTMSS